MVQSDDPSFNYGQSELKYNDFVEPAVRKALIEIKEGLESDGTFRILDAGCGSGGHLKLFKQIFEDIEIVGVDISVPHLKESKRTVESENLEDEVELIQANIEEDLPVENSFDLIWIADVIYPMYFDDPVKLIDNLAEKLDSNGIMAVFCGNWLRQMFLPGYSDLENKINAAVEYWCQNDFHIQNDWRGLSHPENAFKWLNESSLLHSIKTESFLVQYNSEPELPVEAKKYVERTFRKEYDVAIEKYGEKAGITEEDRQLWQEIGKKDGKKYILDEKGYYCCMHPSLVFGQYK